MKPTPARLILLLTLVHGLLWCVYYSGTPLGESPALDNRQTLLLAQHMAEGTLSDSPFHRAPLYPFLLSLPLHLGLPFGLLPAAARMLNLAALAYTAFACARCAAHLWPASRAAPWLGGLLVGLNPVLLFFAGDAFDILAATALLFGGIHVFLSAKNPYAPRPALAIGGLLAAGAALRSHVLPLALLWPAAVLVFSGRGRPKAFAAAAAGPLLGFLLLGAANWQVAGQFRMLPWQGAYNLWAGNQPGASGRIYAQSVSVDFDRGVDNPAMLESITLYERDTGAAPPHTVAEMNRHWLRKTLRHIADQPLQWTELMVRKAYYFLNSYEQYDNKTYGFHKRRHPQLRHNPIHWGALLLLAVAGVFAGSRDPRKQRALAALIAVFAVYAAGTILFYTSNRFRVPMIPVLALLGAGAATLPAWWRSAGNGRRLWCAACLAATALLTYSGWFNARDKSTWTEDRALLANAHLRLGENRRAVEWADKVLAERPGRTDMRGLRVQARFNQWALDPDAPAPDRARTQRYFEQARRVARLDPDFSVFAGIYAWKLDRHAVAERYWRAADPSDPVARMCLVWTGLAPAPEPDALERYRDHRNFPLLRAALAARGKPAHPAHPVIGRILAPTERETQ